MHVRYLNPRSVSRIITKTLVKCGNKNRNFILHDVLGSYDGTTEISHS